MHDYVYPSIFLRVLHVLSVPGGRRFSSWCAPSARILGRAQRGSKYRMLADDEETTTRKAGAKER